MKYFLPLLLLLAGCQGMNPKGAEIGLKIDFTKAPTAKEVRVWQKVQKWKKVKGGWTNQPVKTVNPPARDEKPVLINGDPVDKAKYPHVLRIQSASGAGCTASLVGPQAILTAAHCAETGEKVSFTTVDGKKYTAIMTRFDKWPDTDLDLNIGKVSAVVEGIKPVLVRTDRFEKKDMLIDMIGYGCTQPGGTGGNDGVLRMGKGKITGAQAFDLILDAAPSALCYGDSGGPVFFEGKQIGVNSKGNIKDVSYTTRTTLPEAKAFLESSAKNLGLVICGVTDPCEGFPPSPTPPGPKQFIFENDVVKIEGLIK